MAVNVVAREKISQNFYKTSITPLITDDVLVATSKGKTELFAKSNYFLCPNSKTSKKFCKGLIPKNRLAGMDFQKLY